MDAVRLESECVEEVELMPKREFRQKTRYIRSIKVLVDISIHGSGIMPD